MDNTTTNVQGREIKFRAIVPVNSDGPKSMHYFDLSKDDDCNRLSYADYDASKLMQFTGLRDKSGKEIYEGDRVKRRIMQDGMDWMDMTCEVRWGKWCYCLYILDKYITCLDVPTANSCTVVGNVYERSTPKPEGIVVSEGLIDNGV